MSFGNFMTTVRSYAALDAWSASLSEMTAGMTKIGYKANRTTFLGNATLNAFNPARGTLMRTGEQTLYSETRTDWSQGELIDSSGANHFGINGQGFFVLMDDEGKFFLTRSGNFSLRDGKLKTPEGLTVVDKSIWEGLGKQMLPPTLSATRGVLTTAPGPGYDTPFFTPQEWTGGPTTEWHKAAAASNGWWLPFDPATPTEFNEGNGTYRYDMVAAKTSFFIDKDNPVTSASFGVLVDNFAHIYVNGHELSVSDVTSTAVVAGSADWGGYPAAWDGGAGGSKFNIAPYLQDGLNTITMIGTEQWGGEGFRVSEATHGAGNSRITFQDGTFRLFEDIVAGDTRWATKHIGTDPDAEQVTVAYPTHPTQTHEERAFNAEGRDFLLAQVDFKDGLRYSKYGSTIFEAGIEAGELTLWEQNTGGAGQVLQGKLEASNVNPDNLGGEMALAGQLYEKLAGILEARGQMLDTLFQFLLP